jgi:NAD(P) transhydrogenase
MDQDSRFVRAPQVSHYDLIVLGSGPGGQRAAVQAAKLGKRVLVVEKQRLGGSCLHLGTIPSKALREAALAAVPDGGSLLRPVMARTHRVIEDECTVIESALGRNHVDFVAGTGSFVNTHALQVENAAGKFAVTGDYVLIAVGTRPRRPPELNFDDEILFDSDSILGIDTQPRSLLVLGAGVIGCEYASIFARMGVRVTLVESRPNFLSSIDPEIVETLKKHFEKTGITVRVATKFETIEPVVSSEGRPMAAVKLIDPQQSVTEHFDAVLYCLGRSGNYEDLNLSAIGIPIGERGIINVNRNYQTTHSHIYAVGDIIGAPALAASSAEQGRLAALHAFTGLPAEFPDTFPYGIYTIPEISSVGFHESQLASRGIKYVVGKASYGELARGKMINDEHGFLKLVVHAKTHRVVGIHVIGTSATELVHIGQVAIAFGANVEFFVDNVFNYPTLAEAYKVAAYNAINQLNAKA